MNPADALQFLKQTLLDFRGVHLQARTALLAAQRIVSSKSASDLDFDDFAAVANSLAELNLAMNAKEAALLDRIHAAERETAHVH